MDSELSEMIEISIQQELQMSEMYRLFHHGFPQDGEFWWKMALEEQNHAALLKSMLLFLVPADVCLCDLFDHKLEKLKKDSVALSQLVDRFQQVLPSREEAFATALMLECSFNEFHYQRFMNRSAETELHKAFQKLSEHDLDHVNKIRAYMEAHQIAKARPTHVS